MIATYDNLNNHIAKHNSYVNMALIQRIRKTIKEEKNNEKQ